MPDPNEQNGTDPDALPAALAGLRQGEPRDVLADRISTWVEDDWKVYDYADRLIRDLDNADYMIVSRASVQREEDEIAARVNRVRDGVLAFGDVECTDEEAAEMIDQLEADGLVERAAIARLHRAKVRGD